MKSDMVRIILNNLLITLVVYIFMNIQFDWSAALILFVILMLYSTVGKEKVDSFFKK